jgi:parvulin-like peptidyl-prolyl isomerase
MRHCVLLLLLLAVALLLSPAPATAQGRTVDCVAAVVNGGIVTRFDVEVAEAFGLFDPIAAADPAKAADPAARRAAILNRLIDQKLVIDQIRPSAPVPDPAAVDAEWRRLLARAGSDAIRSRLDRLGMNEADVRLYIGEKVLFRKILDDRFLRTVSVSLREIESFYADTFVPARRAEGRTAQPLVGVLDAIEAEIKKAKIEAQAAAWIDALRDQAEVEIRADCLK